MSKKSPNICPGCAGEFTARKNGACPVCGAKLNLIRDKQLNKSVLVKYVLAEPEKINVEDAKPTETRMAYGVQVSKLAKDRWSVIYRSRVERCVCPNCRKLQMNILQIANGHKVERKCDKCGHYTIYQFDLL